MNLAFRPASRGAQRRGLRRVYAPSAPVQRIGEVAGRRLVAFWLKDQRVPAATNVNVWEGTGQIQALIRSHPRFDRRADAGSPLADLVSQRERGQGDV
jgi:hypothetical protein